MYRCLNIEFKSKCNDRLFKVPQMLLLFSDYSDVTVDSVNAKVSELVVADAESGSGGVLSSAGFTISPQSVSVAKPGIYWPAGFFSFFGT